MHRDFAQRVEVQSEEGAWNVALRELLVALKWRGEERQIHEAIPDNGIDLDREQFLSETCRKAHLLRDAWRDARTQILGFTCDVFSDADAEPAPVGSKMNNAAAENKSPRDVPSRGPEKPSLV